MAYDLLSGKKTPRDWSCGSLLLPERQEKVFLSKIDDVRYDVRGAKNTIGAALFALSGGLTVLAISSIYRSRVKEKKLEKNR